MAPLPGRSVRTLSPDKHDAEWAARLALSGAAGFTLLLFAFGYLVFSAWPQISGVRQSVGSLSARADRIVAGQEMIVRDIGTLRADLRDDRAKRADETRDIEALRTRIAELTSAISNLREQAAKLQESPKAAAPAPHAAAPLQDPAIAEVWARLEQLQRRVDQLAVTPAAAAAPAASPVSLTPAKPNYPVDEIDREVRDMQEVVRRQRQAPPASHTVSRAAAAGRSIADPLAPITSKSPPRIAPVRSDSRAHVSAVPCDASAQQTVSPDAAVPEVRVTRVGVNSAMKAIGPLGLPFDAVGNLITAIGEGLDHLFTGRTYAPRPAPGDEAANARR